MSPLSLQNWTHNHLLRSWIKEIADHCLPKSIYLCDGSKQEYESLCEKMVQSGSFIPLNPIKRPFSFLARSNPHDVARSEERTFICSEKQIDAGPTNFWRDPLEMKQTLNELFQGCMNGRTMYVVPFSMGPIGSDISQIGVQITDSPYVVCNMHIMTRIGKAVIESLGDQNFVRCLHSIGMPLSENEKDCPWPCNKEKYIIHFPEERLICSFGSGYGGNALLAKKCFALRIASVMAKDEGWLAEHMLILSVTNPEGKKIYMAAAFPSSCGKTNLAMLNSTLPGWKIETVGDDIAWMKFDKNGVLRAINPESGFFGVAPGTSLQSNPNAMKTCSSRSIFTNTALTDDQDVWWEGMSASPPSHLIDWKGEDWYAGSSKKAAHPNARFTASLTQCPTLDSHWNDPQGVPISALIFGGRRSSVVPLVCESFSWQHGVFMGVGMCSETTAAADGEVGKLRHDPFAMLPFCGYHMGDYFNHWLEMGRKHSAISLPRIYYVNWFLKGKSGEWLWPGFGENCRVLKWIFERVLGKADALSSPIGNLPSLKNFDVSGLEVSQENLKELFNIDIDGHLKDLKELENYLKQFGDRLPKEILEEIENLKKRLNGSSSSQIRDISPHDG